MKKTIKIFLLINCFVLAFNFSNAQTWTGYVQYPTGYTCPIITYNNLAPFNKHLGANPVLNTLSIDATGAASNCNGYFFTSAMARGTICLPNNFSFEFIVRNNDGNGSVFRNDIGIQLFGAGLETGCYLVGFKASEGLNGPGNAAQFASAFVRPIGQPNNGTTVTGDNSLTFQIDGNFHTYRLQYRNNRLTYFRDNQRFFDTTYQGNICSIDSIRFAFKGAGDIDMLRFLDVNNNQIWREDFDNPNNITPFPFTQYPANCNPNLNKTLSFTNPTCTNNILQLSATPANTNALLSYLWTGPNGFISTAQNPVIQNPTAANNGIYICVTSLNNCSQQTQANTLNVNFVPPTLPPNTGGNTVCVNGTTYLSNPTAGGNWVSSNDNIVTVDPSTGEVTGMAIGNANITYTVGACSAVTNVQVLTVASPIQGNTTICVGSLTVLSNATSGGTWQSSNPAVATVDLYTGVVKGISPGTAVISYFINNGTTTCRSTKKVTVTSITAPPANIVVGTTNLCVGQQTYITATNINKNVTWTIGKDNPNANLSCTLCNSTNFSASVAGTYTVFVTGYQNGSTAGCQVGGSVQITVHPYAPVPNVTSPIQVCVGSMQQQLSPRGSNYLWMDNAGNKLNDAPYTDPTQPVGSQQTYSVAGVSPFGCNSESATVIINYISCCNDQCYWTVNGNNIYGDEDRRVNILGTISRDDIRIKTSNEDRGVFTWDGRFGLNTGYPPYPKSNSPSTLFHINCDMEKLKLENVGHSAVRLEKLQEKEDGYVLIIDKEGYVFKSKTTVGKEMETLERKVETLSKKLDEAYKIIETYKIKIDAAALDENDISQNSPNPFNGTTTIEYNVKSYVKDAFVSITNYAGKEIKRFNIAKKGKGNLAIEVNGLSSGVYNYSLFIDGKLINTKQMSLIAR